MADDPTKKNIEYNFINYLVTRLESIDETGQYNNNLEGRVYRTHKLVTEVDSFPVISMGEFIAAVSVATPRNCFQLPMHQDIWGYAANESDPHGEVLKLVSDIRNAIGAEETLAGTVYKLGFAVNVGTIKDKGICLVEISCTADYILL